MAVLVVVLLIAGNVPDAKAWVRFSDGSVAESAVACYADNVTTMIINGVRGTVSASSWQQHGYYASTSGIWVTYRVYDAYLNAWTPYPAFVSLPSGYTFGYLTFPRWLQGNYKFETLFTKWIGGRWEYRSQLSKVFQVSHRDAYVDMQALVNYSGALGTTCRQ